MVSGNGRRDDEKAYEKSGKEEELRARQVLDPEQGDGEGRWGVERVVNLAVLHANTT